MQYKQEGRENTYIHTLLLNMPPPPHKVSKVISRPKVHPIHPARNPE